MSSGGKVKSPKRVLVVFNTVCFYGMERATMEIFDLLRPDVASHFLIQRSNQRYGTRLLREFRARNLSFSFFSDTWDWPRLGKPRSIAELGKMLWSIAVANVDAFRACLNHDAIYLPVISSGYLAFAACVYYRLTRRRVIYHFHDMASSPKRRLKIMNLWVTDYVHNARISQEIVQNPNEFITKRANHCIPLMVDRRRFDSQCIPEGWQRNVRHIVYAGQLARHKGIGVLIDAFKILASAYADIRLDLLGGDNDNFEKTVRQCRELDGRVAFWGFRDDALQFLRLAYVYVQPTLSPVEETGCLAVLEAMFAGTPAVCFRSGVLTEYVVNGESGLLCQQEDAKCLADAIRRFLDDPGFRDSCGLSARRRYLEHYSGTLVRRSWLDLIEN